MAIDTTGWCMNCSGCTLALQRARQHASEQANKSNPKCTCNSDTGASECPIASRYQEPLAWSISPTETKDQNTSMLYTLIPREIRDMIFSYALTDTTSWPVDREPAGPPGAEGRRDRHLYRQRWGKFSFYPSDIAFSLLSTCKAVYLETYTLPLRLNPFFITELKSQVKKHHFYSWQIAQIARLDIKLPQLSLENGALRNALKEWKAHVRSRKCYVVPQEAVLLYGVDKTLDDCPVFFDNVLIPTDTTKIIDKRPQPINDVLCSAHIPEATAQPCSSNLRVSLASTITHLTLRLASQDWWTWSDDPVMSNSHQKLRLDPTFGDPKHSRGSPDEMRFLASERRSGRHPVLGTECWGNHVSSLLPDLQVLELVLETFELKVNQLDDVAECARTWRFDFGENTLAWDGEVVEKRWQRGIGGLRLPKDASWFGRCRDYEVRVVRFTRKRK